MRLLTALAAAAALLATAARSHFTAEVPPLEPTTAASVPRLTERVLLIVVDGLRHDTALESGSMPELQRLAASGAAGVAETTPITMTGVGIRAIGTGVSPSLIDLARNWRLPEVEFDNIFWSVHQRGGQIYVMGNSTWSRLFGPWVKGVKKPPRYVKHLNPVYGEDRFTVRRALEVATEDDWELAVVHLGGVDNASHLWTAFSPRFERKVRRIDREIAQIVAAAGPETTVVVTSDHGTSDRGQHGGMEPEERRTPLIFAGPGIGAGGFDARQVDIAATLAVLLGLPVPAPVEGTAIAGALDLKPDERLAIAAAERRRHARYARAYASHFGLEVPTLDGEFELGRWLAANRTRGVSTLLWALALALTSMLLVVPAGEGRRLRSVALVAILACSAATLAAPALAGALALIATSLAICTHLIAARSHFRSSMVGLRTFAWALVLAAAEAAVLLWRIHRRGVQIIYKHHKVAVAVAVGATACALAFGLWRAVRRPIVSAAPLALCLLVGAMVGDWHSLWVLVGMGLVALASAWRRVDGPLPLVLAGLCSLQLVLSTDVAIPGLAAALLLGSAWMLRTHVPATAAWLCGALALLASAALLVGIDSYSVVALVGIAIASAAAAARRGTSVEYWLSIGWLAAALIALLSRSEQILGVGLTTAVALAAGRLKVLRAGDRRSLLVATLLVIGLRMSFFALFEGGFHLGHLEIWLGFVGDPSARVFGGVLVATKFMLPGLLVLALVTRHMPATARRQVIEATLAFFLLRTAHVVLAIGAASHTFYGPYHDLGHLLLTLALAAGFAIAALGGYLPLWCLRRGARV